MSDTSGVSSEFEYVESPSEAAGDSSSFEQFSNGLVPVLRGARARLSSENYLSESDRSLVSEIAAADRLIYTIDHTKVLALVEKIRTGGASFDALKASSALLEQHLTLADVRINLRKSGLDSAPDRVREYFATHGKPFRFYYEGVPMDQINPPADKLRIEYDGTELLNGDYVRFTVVQHVVFHFFKKKVKFYKEELHKTTG